MKGPAFWPSETARPFITYETHLLDQYFIMNILKYKLHNKNAGLLDPASRPKSMTMLDPRHNRGRMLKFIYNNTIVPYLNAPQRLFLEALHDYTAAPLRQTTVLHHYLYALEFEKKICRTGFKKAFGQNLPSPGSLELNFGLLDVNPTIDSARWKKKKTVLKKDNHHGVDFNNEPSKKLSKRQPLIADLCFRGKEMPTKMINCSRRDKRFIVSGIQLMSSNWVLERLVDQIKNKRSVRAVMNEIIRDVDALMNHLLSACPVLGVRITASGRLGKKKKGMAQQQTLSIGKVPLGSFNKKVDYSQGFVVTKLGCVGLKVWVAFR